MATTPKFNLSPFGTTRRPRSPKKSRNELSLRRIIGTTVNSPNAFDSLSSLRIFAYTAGAAAVVVKVGDGPELDYTQRFFRARPSTTPTSATNIPVPDPSTPTNEFKNRAVTALRENGIAFSPSTPTPQADWGESPTSKTWTSRERIKAATCLSISRDGRFLAVGETGYAPRVLIFSISESSDRPIVILNDHTFGVRAVKFSPDGRYLASLGNVNDGFLYVWAINSKTGAARLHSSNKCTSFIKGMAWMCDNTLVTVGTRHVKVWRIDDPFSVSPSKTQSNQDGSNLSPPILAGTIKMLSGRNCLLGILADVTFTCIASISDSSAIVCTDKGDICILKDNAGQTLTRLGTIGMNVTCVAVDSDARIFRIGGRSGLSEPLSLEEVTKAGDTGFGLSFADRMPSTLNPVSISAIEFVDQVLISIDSQHAIRMLRKEDTAKEDPPGDSVVPLISHRDSIMGVRLLDRAKGLAFLTWSSSGTVLFWNLDGRSQGCVEVELEQHRVGEDGLPNQLLVVRATSDATLLITGDKLGVMSIIDGTSKDILYRTKAHSSDITDIDIHQDDVSHLIASCGRDRTVQLFRKLPNSEWMLLQTVDDHTAVVCCLTFSDSGRKLLSCSTDRTIQIRQLVTREINGQEITAAISMRVVNLKASPVSMALYPNGDKDIFVVSLLDRTVATYDISGKLISSFRALDSEGSDSVVMDALVLHNSSHAAFPTLLAGVSSTDKSVRLYDADSGTLLSREWGHTASVTDVALLEEPELDRTTLISTGADGTIMIWDLSTRTPDFMGQPDSSDDRINSPTKDSSFAKPPLRRVLSRAELSAFQSTLPVSTPTRRGSPPRPLRTKTSRYGSLSAATASPKLTITPIPTVTPSNVDQGDYNSQRRGSRTRSRSPVRARRLTKRPSLANLDVYSRAKSSTDVSSFGSLNNSTENICRTLQAYRRKLLGTESIRVDILDDLAQELKLTAKMIEERALKEKAASDKIVAGLLDQYSEQILSRFDHKLRLSRKGSRAEDDMREAESLAESSSS